MNGTNFLSYYLYLSNGKVLSRLSWATFHYCRDLGRPPYFFTFYLPNLLLLEKKPLKDVKVFKNPKTNFFPTFVLDIGRESKLAYKLLIFGGLRPTLHFGINPVLKKSLFKNRDEDSLGLPVDQGLGRLLAVDLSFHKIDLKGEKRSSDDQAFKAPVFTLTPLLQVRAKLGRLTRFGSLHTSQLKKIEALSFIKKQKPKGYRFDLEKPVDNSVFKHYPSYLPTDLYKKRSYRADIKGLFAKLGHPYEIRRRFVYLNMLILGQSFKNHFARKLKKVEHLDFVGYVSQRGPKKANSREDRTHNLDLYTPLLNLSFLSAYERTKLVLEKPRPAFSGSATIISGYDDVVNNPSVGPRKVLPKPEENTSTYNSFFLKSKKSFYDYKKKVVAPLIKPRAILKTYSAFDRAKKIVLESSTDLYSFYSANWLLDFIIRALSLKNANIKRVLNQTFLYTRQPLFSPTVNTLHYDKDNRTIAKQVAGAGKLDPLAGDDRDQSRRRLYAQRDRRSSVESKSDLLTWPYQAKQPILGNLISPPSHLSDSMSSFLKSSLDRLDAKRGSLLIPGLLKGLRITFSGRLGGKRGMAKTLTKTTGRVPLSSYGEKIDFAKGVVHTKSGSLGVKVWLCYN